MKYDKRLRWYYWIIEEPGVPDDWDLGAPTDSYARSHVPEFERVRDSDMVYVSHEAETRLRAIDPDAFRIWSLENGILTEADWLYIDAMSTLELLGE